MARMRTFDLQKVSRLRTFYLCKELARAATS
jgi:hypothetical protein